MTRRNRAHDAAPAPLSRARSARRRRAGARRLRPAVASAVVSEGAGRGRDAERAAPAKLVTRPQGDGAGIHGGRPVADVPQQRHRRARQRRVRGARRERLRRLRARGRRTGRSAAPLLARRIARAADAARRSRGTIASRAGARSASGRARRCPRCSTPCSRSRRALRRVPLRRPDGAGRRSHYYESIDMDDAYHPQTILAYELNDAAAAGRRTARRSACASSASSATSTAKYVMRIELVESFAHIARRQGRLLGGPGLPVVRRDLNSG